MDQARRLSIALLGDGSSPHIQRLAINLAERGHALHIITEDRFGPFPTLEKIAFHSYPSRVGMHQKILAICALLKHIRPDVLNSHFVNHGGYRGAATGYHPHVITAWGTDVLVHARKPSARIKMAIALRSADWLLSDANALREAMQRITRRAERNDVVPWGVDCHWFAPGSGGHEFRECFGLGNRPVVYSPRALTPLYNQDVMIEAWPDVLAQVPTAILLIKEFNTDPVYQAQLRRRAEALRITQSVRFLGDLSREQFRDAYLAADAVVSIPSSDGTPMTVLEAMACGRVIIAGDLPALREWIREGQNGYLVPPRDAGRLGEAIMRALTLPLAERAAIGEHNRNLILQRAERAMCLERIEQIFRAAAGNRTPGFSYLRSLSNLSRLREQLML